MGNKGACLNKKENQNSEAIGGKVLWIWEDREKQKQRGEEKRYSEKRKGLPNEKKDSSKEKHGMGHEKKKPLGGPRAHFWLTMPDGKGSE